MNNKEIITKAIVSQLQGMQIKDESSNVLKTVKCVSRKFSDLVSIGDRLPIIIVVTGQQASVIDMSGDDARPYDVTFYLDMYGVVQTTDTSDMILNYFIQSIDDVVSNMFYDASVLPKAWKGQLISFGSGDDILSRFGLATVPGRMCKLTYKINTVVGC